MSKSVSIVGTLSASLGQDGSSPPSREDLSFTYSYNQKVDADINTDAPVTDLVVGLNRLAVDGGRAIFVRVLIGVVFVKLNGGPAIPIAAGAGDLWIANQTQGWLTEVKITTNSAAKAVIRVYG